MGLVFAEVERIKEEFQQEYFLSSPWNKYVNMCGISLVGVKDRHSSPEEKNDLCISVGICKPLPKNLSLPKIYKGVRVIVEKIGRIVFV